MMSFRKKGFTSIFSSVMLVLVLSVFTQAADKHIWILGDSHVGGNYGLAKEETYQSAIAMFLEAQDGDDHWYSCGTMEGISYTDDFTTPISTKKVRYTGYPGATTATITSNIKDRTKVYDKLVSSKDGKTIAKPNVVMIVTGTNDINAAIKARKKDAYLTLYADVQKLIQQLSTLIPESEEPNNPDKYKIGIWLITPMVDATPMLNKKKELISLGAFNDARNTQFRLYGKKMPDLIAWADKNKTGVCKNISTSITYNAWYKSTEYMPSEFQQSLAQNKAKKEITFGWPHEHINTIKGKKSEWMHPCRSFSEIISEDLYMYYGWGILGDGRNICNEPAEVNFKVPTWERY